MPEYIDESQLPHLSAFERIKHLDEDGREWWSAREFMLLLIYSKWQDFHSPVPVWYSCQSCEHNFIIGSQPNEEASMRQSQADSSRSDRRIPISKEGRIGFRPGGKHPLDVQLTEARLVKEHLAEQLERFAEMLHALASLAEVATRFEAEDEALRHYLAEHYQDYFHVDHLTATFLWLRRRRAIARLQAAQAALGLVQELLAPDSFVDGLLEMLRERAPEEVEVDRAQMTGNAQGMRERLAHYDAQLQVIRAAISRGNGWIEQFYVHKASWKPEIIRLAYAFWQERKQGTPVPPEVLAQVLPEIAACLRDHKPIPLRLKEEATQEMSYGPYFKYRWREGSSPIYTISLGRLSERPERMLPFRPYLRFSKE